MNTVLGIDVGYSATRKTTGFCALQWNDQIISWQCENASSDAAGRLAALHKLLPAEPRRVLAIAIDGPLRPNLVVDTSQYRSAESFLSRGDFQKRGKPGQTHAGSGPRLHEAATALARFAQQHLQLKRDATNLICDHPIVEAFPNLFLGVLCDEPYPRPERRRKWTDALHRNEKVQNKLKQLLLSLLPNREIKGDWHLNRDHEKIAALACALTALCFWAGRFTAVGSRADGYIILPPRAFWGSSANPDSPPWAERELQKVESGVSGRFPQACYWEKP